MTTTAQSVIHRAVDTLQDANSTRWTTAELVRYLNDGQNEILVYRPDAFATSTTLSLSAGAKQTLPSTAAKLLDVIRNSADSSTKKAVRIVNRQLLDAQYPDWHNATATVNTVHYMYDPIDPRVFYVYPPATTFARLDVVLANYPTPITEPSAGTTYTAVTGNISVPDIMATALMDYIVFRAFHKDAEYANNGTRAQTHYALFTNALNTDFKGTTGVVPSPFGAPVHGSAA